MLFLHSSQQRQAMGKTNQNFYDNPKIILKAGATLFTQVSHNDFDRLFIFDRMKHFLP